MLAKYYVHYGRRSRASETSFSANCTSRGRRRPADSRWPHRSAGDRAERGTVDGHVRQREIRMVEDIEELGAELQVHALADPRRLQHRKIRQVGARADHGVPSGVAKGSRRSGHEAAVLNQASQRFGPSFGLPTAFGRSLLDSPLPLGAAPFQKGVIGRPLASV